MAKKVAVTSCKANGVELKGNGPEKGVLGARQGKEWKRVTCGVVWCGWGGL